MNDIIKGFENFVNTSLFTLIVKENEDIEKYMKKHRRVLNDDDKVFNSEAYDDIINQSNSVVISMLGMNTKIKDNDDEYDKIQNIIDMIKTSELSIDTMSSSPPKQNVNKTKIIIDDKTRFKLKLDQINKVKVNINISNITIKPPYTILDSLLDSPFLQ